LARGFPVPLGWELVSSSSTLRLQRRIKDELLRDKVRSREVVEVFVAIGQFQADECTGGIVTISDLIGVVVVLEALDTVEHSRITVLKVLVKGDVEIGEIVGVNILHSALGVLHPDVLRSSIGRNSLIRTEGIDSSKEALASGRLTNVLLVVEEAAVGGSIDHIIIGGILKENGDAHSQIA